MPLPPLPTVSAILSKANLCSPPTHTPQRLPSRSGEKPGPSIIWPLHLSPPATATKLTRHTPTSGPSHLYSFCLPCPCPRRPHGRRARLLGPFLKCPSLSEAFSGDPWSEVTQPSHIPTQTHPHSALESPARHTLLQELSLTCASQALRRCPASCRVLQHLECSRLILLASCAGQGGHP